MKVKNILGITIKDLSKEAFLDIILDSIDEKNKINIAIANAHTINLTNKDKEYFDIINSFFVINDGFGLELASKILYGKGFVDNLNGTDLIPYIFSNTPKEIKVYLYGAKPDVVVDCVRSIKSKYKNINICGYVNGYVDDNKQDELINKINSSDADILLVAKGNPVQEKWIYKNREKLLIPVSIGVGALFDFMSGDKPRAPYIIRKFRMEWFYRLCIEPKRMWKRYLLGNIVFISKVFKQKITRLRTKKMIS